MLLSRSSLVWFLCLLAKNGQETDAQFVYGLFSEILHLLSIPINFGLMVTQTQSYGFAVEMTLGYGCWCGRGNSGNHLARPVDRIDECCKIHDNAYGTAYEEYLDVPMDVVKIFGVPLFKAVYGVEPNDLVLLQARLSSKKRIEGLIRGDDFPNQEIRKLGELVMYKSNPCIGGNINYKFQLDPYNRSKITCFDHPETCAGILCRADRRAAQCFLGQHRNPDFTIVPEPAYEVFAEKGARKGFDRSKSCHYY